MQIIMKPQRRTKESIDRLPDEPIDIEPFDPISKQKAGIYCERLNRILAPFGACAELSGSLELEIATKGEWDLAIFLNDEQWFPMLVCLINRFHSNHFLEDDFAVFTDQSEGTDVEVFPMRDLAAQRNRAILDYWRNNPAALKEYEQGKLQHAFSKREYYRWKDEYIARIVEAV
jgi:hypothetical protein